MVNQEFAEDTNLSARVIGAAIEVHRNLGPGLLESAYESALGCELDLRGLAYQRQLALPLFYKGIELRNEFRLDLVVEKELVIEVKSVDSLRPVHSAQIITYLKLSGIEEGLLLNFNEALMKDGVKRHYRPK